MSGGRKHLKKKKNHQNNAVESELSLKRAKQKAAFRKNRRYILPLIINTVFFFGIYYYLVNETDYMMPTLWVYFTLTAGFCFAYVIYNRGFSRMNLTPDMLPASMSAEEKAAYIENGKERLEKSKWMLTVIFPLLMTFILDVFMIFILDPMLELAGYETLASAVPVL